MNIEAWVMDITGQCSSSEHLLPSSRTPPTSGCIRGDKTVQMKGALLLAIFCVDIVAMLFFRPAASGGLQLGTDFGKKGADLIQICCLASG